MQRQLIRDFNSSLFFSNGSVSLTEVPSVKTSSTMTLCTWIKGWNDGGGNGRIFCKYDDTNNEYQISYGQNTGSIISDFKLAGTRYQSGSATAPVSLPGIWHFVVVTFNAGTIKTYIDGVDVSTGAGTSPGIATADTNLRLGISSTGNALQAYLTDTRLYQRVLSPGEIVNLFNGIEPPTTNLSVWWKLNDATGGSALDSSGNGNTGTLGGSTTPTWSLDVPMRSRQLLRQLGTSVQFNASGQVTIPGGVGTNLNFGTNSFGFGLWLKILPMNISGTYQPIFKGGQSNASAGFDYEITTSNSLRGGISDGTTRVITGTYIINSNEWHFYYTVVDRSAQRMQLYVDGIKVGSTINISAEGSVSNTGVSLLLGTTTRGLLDEVYIHNIALTPAQVLSLYYGTDINFSNLAAYYKCDDGAGTSIADSSGNGNTGTLATGTFSLDVPIRSRQIIRPFGTVYANPNNTNAFNSSTDYQFSTAVSMGGWLKRGNLTALNTVIIGRGRYSGGGGASNYGYSMAINTSHQLSFFITKLGTATGSQLNSTAIIRDNNWHHFAATYQSVTDGTSIANLYIDGQLVGNATNFVSPIFNSNMDLGVGNEWTSAPHGGANSVLQGMLDEVFIYNGVLTQGQIQGAMASRPDIFFTGDANLYGCWNFDDAQGLVATDSSTRGNNLTLSAASWASEAVMRQRLLIRDFGSAGVFNGSDNSLTLTSPTAFKTDNKTVCFWANPSIKVPTTTGLFGLSTSNFYVGMAAGQDTFSSYVDASVAQQTLASPGIYDKPNQWHFYAYTFNVSGSNVTVTHYVDGEMVAQKTLTTGYSSTYGTVAVIGGISAAGNLFTGMMDEVRFYNTPLTQDQVKQLFYSGTEPALSSLVGYWKFDENTGSTVADKTGNGHTATWNGTLGAQWTSNVSIIPRSLT